MGRRGGCANTIPSRGRRHLIQADSMPISRATFPSAPFLSSLRSSVDFSGWNETRLVFSKGYRKLAGISLPSEKGSAEADGRASQGRVPMKASEVTTHTQKSWAEIL